MLLDYQGELILTVNAGSSSIKMGLFAGQQKQPPKLLMRGKVDGIGTQPRIQIKDTANNTVADLPYSVAEVGNLTDAFRRIYAIFTEILDGKEPTLVGHRVVHGGNQFSHPILVNQQVLQQLEEITPLAPLHQPYNLASMRLISDNKPEIPQVACFDTAFHAKRDELHKLFALPYEMYQQGIKSYGFHGLSFEYISQFLQQNLPELSHKKIVIAHLGNGSSLCAIEQGKCVEVTTSFTALDGVPMATRTGALDVGVILHLLRQGKNVAELEQLVYKESGLLGISGVSSDMRTLKASNEQRAKLAIDYYALHIAQYIARLAVSLGGLDAVVFTAGIGEKDASLRTQVLNQLSPLFGFKLDQQANQNNQLKITTSNSNTLALVIPTDEEKMIANHAWRIYQQL